MDLLLAVDRMTVTVSPWFAKLRTRDAAVRYQFFASLVMSMTNRNQTSPATTRSSASMTLTLALRWLNDELTGATRS